MTQTLIGLDYEGAPCLKITKGNLNPITTLDATPGAFLFNSKDTIQTKLLKVDTTSDSDPITLPVGSTTTTFQKRYYNYQNRWRPYFYQKSFFPGLDFDYPLTDFVAKDRITGWYIKGKQHYYDYSASQQNSNVGYCRLYVPTARYGEAGWKVNYNVNVADWDGAGNVNYASLLTFVNVSSNNGAVQFIPNTYSDVICWNLPGDNQPIPTPLTPVSGQKSIRLDNTGFKIAKPGYDVDTANESQLALSSVLRATKIISAEDIAIPTGSSEYILSVPVPTNSICDIQYYTGSELVYPALPRSTPIGANWRLLSDRIQFQNDGAACRARFLVIVNDQVSTTTGDNEVLRQFDVGGTNVVQILKPGSANPPAFSDIIIDSRWPSLRILKEGYFTVGTGAQITNIPIDTTGYYPFIKMMVVTNGREVRSTSNIIIEKYDKVVRPPLVSMARLNDAGGWFETGDTTYAKVTSDNVAFYTFRGRPKYYFWYFANSTGWRLDTTYPDEVVGIRYYIFGIPKE